MFPVPWLLTCSVKPSNIFILLWLLSFVQKTFFNITIITRKILRMFHLRICVKMCKPLRPLQQFVQHHPSTNAFIHSCQQQNNYLHVCRQGLLTTTHTNVTQHQAAWATSDDQMISLGNKSLKESTFSNIFCHTPLLNHSTSACDPVSQPISAPGNLLVKDCWMGAEWRTVGQQRLLLAFLATPPPPDHLSTAKSVNQ